MASSSDRIRKAWQKLGKRERLVLATIAERLLVGQETYGELKRNKKDWLKELQEECMDGLVYIAAACQDMDDDETDGKD